MLLVFLYGLNSGAEDSKKTNVSYGCSKKILIDPGHGGEDPGAVSDYSGIKEKDVNLKISQILKELLENDKYEVLLTREEDKLQYSENTKSIIQKRREDLIKRKKIMDNSGADIVVSIHLNKFPQTQYFGAQTFYPPDSPESKRLAETIQKSLVEIVDQKNKRKALVKNSKPTILILSNIKTTTVIVECGFLSNSEEEIKLQDDKHIEKIAVAIKDGIDNYFALE